MTIYSGFSHEKWWFSIVMLVYQRVLISSHCRWNIPLLSHAVVQCSAVLSWAPCQCRPCTSPRSECYRSPTSSAAIGGKIWTGNHGFSLMKYRGPVNVPFNQSNLQQSPICHKGKTMVSGSDFPTNPIQQLKWLKLFLAFFLFRSLT